MKYLPTVDLYDPAISEAVRSGRLRLQTGQWVRCGEGQLSRFVCHRPRSLWVAHPRGDYRTGTTKRSFPELVAIKNSR